LVLIEVGVWRGLEELERSWEKKWKNERMGGEEGGGRPYWKEMGEELNKVGPSYDPKVLPSYV
jgi:hypothetical protein